MSKIRERERSEDSIKAQTCDELTYDLLFEKLGKMRIKKDARLEEIKEHQASNP